jgi:nucleoside 2-deoxyribosyltransferase
MGKTAYDYMKDTAIKAYTLRSRTVYLAGPFFSKQQTLEVEKIEVLMNRAAVSYFSPRLECRYTPGDPEVVAARTFFLNQHHIKNCQFIVALLTYPDTGTAWELGYAACMHRPILGLTNNKSVLLNLMVQQTVDGLIEFKKFGIVLRALAVDVERSKDLHRSIRSAEDFRWKGNIE